MPAVGKVVGQHRDSGCHHDFSMCTIYRVRSSSGHDGHASTPAGNSDS